MMYERSFLFKRKSHNLIRKVKLLCTDTQGMEFIDVAVIVIGSVGILSAILAIVSRINNNVDSVNTNIPKYK